MTDLNPQLYPLYDGTIADRIAEIEGLADSITRDVRPYRARIAECGSDFGPEVLALYSVILQLGNIGMAARDALDDLALARAHARRVQKEREGNA